MLNSVKQKIKAHLRNNTYPQRLFFAEINRFLNRKYHNARDIIDIPCGQGHIAYLLANSNNKYNVKGIDIENENIEFAKKHFQSKNLEYKVGDIFDELDCHSKYDAICIVNSMFCLPNNSKILEKANNSLKTDGCLIIIIPNTKGKNYQNFMKYNNGEINVSSKSLEEFVAFVEEFKFDILEVKKIAFTHVYGRKDLKFVPYIQSIYLNLLNDIESVFNRKKEPSYYFIATQKRA